jgi:hypothetical protein
MDNVDIFYTIWNTLRPFGNIYVSLAWFVVIWYIFPSLVCLDQEKSGNPADHTKKAVCVCCIICQYFFKRYLAIYRQTLWNALATTTNHPNSEHTY